MKKIVMYIDFMVFDSAEFKCGIIFKLRWTLLEFFKNLTTQVKVELIFSTLRGKLRTRYGMEMKIFNTFS